MGPGPYLPDAGKGLERHQGEALWRPLVLGSEPVASLDRHVVPLPPALGAVLGIHAVAGETLGPLVLPALEPCAGTAAKRVLA